MMKRLLIGLLLGGIIAGNSFAAVTYRADSQASAAGSNTITYIASGAVGTAGSGNITPALPAHLVGDLLLCLAESSDTVAHSTATSGWTQIYSLSGGAAVNHRASAYYKVALSSAETAPTITHTGGNIILGRCSNFRYVDTTTPFDVAYAAAASAARTDDEIRTGSLTTVTPGALLLFAAHMADNRTRDAVPTGWTDIYYSTTSTGNDAGIGLVRQAQTTPASAGPAVMNISGNATTHGVILALRPAGSTLSINKPTGTSVDDVMVATVAVRPSTISITPPSGWTLIGSQLVQTSGDSLRMATYYRVAVTGEGTSYTWGLPGGTHTGAVGAISTYSGVDTSDAIDAQAGAITASSLNHAAPTVTTTLADGMLVTAHAYASSGNWTPPTGMTEMVDLATASAATGISIETNYEERPSVGATGARTAAASVNADAGATQSVALKAAPLVCYGDNFDRASLGTTWTASNSGGSFGNPVIVNNRLRLTDSTGNVATMATLQRLFPGAGNRIEVQFDLYAYNGSGADGIVLTLSDSSVTPAPGGYGGSLGYAQNTSAVPSKPGFTGGWLGVGIDEYGNFSSPTEGRIGGPALTADSVSIRGSGSGSTGYRYHTGTGTLSPGIDNAGSATAAPGHRYRIIVDHSNGTNAYVSVERNSGAGYVLLIPPYDAKVQSGQVAVPANWIMSLTGSTGGSTNIHEIDNLQICATAQQAISTVNHYHISHSGTGVNCQAEPVTIIAKDASNAATSANGVAITVTAVRTAGAAGNHGDWVLVSGSGVLNNGTADDGIATYTFGTGETTASLALKNTHVQTVNINVQDSNGITEASGVGNTETPYDANLNFVNSAFRISNGANVAATIATQTAGVTSTTYYLQAIRTDTTTGACAAAFPNNTDVTVELGFQCNNPTTCQTLPTAQLVSITNNSNGSTIAANPNSGVTNYTSKVLRFGSNAQAPFTLVYPDVGQLTLYARYNIPLSSGAGSGNYISGSSNPFVVKPYNFLVSNIERTSDGFDNPNAASPSASGTAFIRAGNDFSATVTSVNAQGFATPNYGKEVVAEGARLVSTLVGGLNLTNNPTINNLTAFGSFSGGSASGTTFSWGEVGYVTLAAGVGDNDYLGVGNVLAATGTVLGTQSGNVGRFQPFDFNVAYNTPQFTSFCGTNPNGFTYVGQNFNYGTVPVLTITARNAQGGTTQNYSAAGGWFKLTGGSTGSLTSKTYTALTGTIDTGLIAVTDPVVANTGNGTATATFSSGTGLRFTRGGLVAPFNAEISLAINVIDSDTPTVTYASNPARFSQPTAGNGIPFDQGKIMRFGQLHIFNALGSEKLPLPIPMRLEYWNGTGFVQNTDDSCTSIPRSTLAMDTYQGGLGTCAAPFSSATVNFSGGAANPTLNAPNAAGSVDIRALTGAVPGAAPFLNACTTAQTTATAGSISHLRGRWDDNVNGNGYDDDPVARAAFGLYGAGRSSLRFIYSRENY